MKALARSVERIMSWPYVRKGGESFEKQVVDTLARDLNLPQYIGKNVPPDVQRDYIVFQPRGKQNAPDIEVHWRGKVFYIECKASKQDGSLMWNSGVPEQDYIYLFNAPGGTSAVLGRDLITPDTAQALTDIKAWAREEKQRINARLAGSGWELQHIRPMFQQTPLVERHILKNARRLLREPAVLAFLDDV